MESFDAVVIGAGHNGLVTACYLARAGLSVAVVEKNDWIGGAAVSRELHDGWIYSNCSYVCSLFRPEIMRDLELPKHGLQIVPFEGGGLFTRDGDFLASYGDHEVKRREVARFSKHDSEAMDRYRRDTLRQSRFIRPLLMRTPPDPTSFRPRDIQELLWLGKRFHDLTETEMQDMIRFWTMSIADYLDEYFEHPVIKADRCISGIIGTALGPMSPGTAYVLLHHYMGEVDGNSGAWGYARGGMGAISSALASAFSGYGGTLITEGEVADVLVKDGRVAGVRCADGREVLGRIVASNADVKRTFLKLVQPDELPDTFVKSVRNFKIRGSSGKLNIALDAMPTFPAIPRGAPVLTGDLHFVDSIERIERGYDDWKAGRWSADPFIDMVIPTAVDPTMAPPGKHFMSCFIQYCPPTLATGDWTDADRDAFAETVVQQIAQYSPDFRQLIRHIEVRTPRELEDEVGLTEGNIFQGELTFDQLLFNRPVPGYAQYRSPIKGLYLCGSSAHPGGGVMGAPGRNAAAEILRDLKRPQDVADIREAYPVH